MPKVSDREFQILDFWGRFKFGSTWDKLTRRQKCLFVDDFFFLQYKKQADERRRLVHD